MLHSREARRALSDQAHRRYLDINLPHARTIVARIGRHLETLGAFGEGGNGGAIALHAAFRALTAELAPYDEDPPLRQALESADAAAARGRALAAAIVETACRGDRLGQAVRNLFECLGLAEEGAALALECGENPSSLLR